MIFVYIICFINCRTCISGKEFSVLPDSEEGYWGHQHRATDILLSVCANPIRLSFIVPVLKNSDIDFEVYNKYIFVGKMSIYIWLYLQFYSPEDM